MRFGLIQAIKSGCEGEQSISYTHGGVSGFSVEGGVNSDGIRCSVMLPGENKANQKPFSFLVKDVLLAPDGEFDFFKDDFNELSLVGEMKVPEGDTSAFMYEELNEF